MRWLRYIFWFLLALTVFIGGLLVWLSAKPEPEQITYGMSFNTLYARELGLDWQATYEAILTELGVKHLRLAAHWPMIEPERDVYNFEELDYQIRRAEEEGATVILAVGRRLPRWPECHIPMWARNETWETQKEQLRDYIRIVIERYKDSPAITHWQIENEPYLSMFAYEHCGDLDEAFLTEEVALARSIDTSRPVLVTDSGNLGLWTGAYQQGDAFGTSVYVYFWNPELGQFKTVLPPWFYRVKENLMRHLYGDKPTFLIELSAEPWLVSPVTEVPLETQYTQMNVEKFDQILEYARDTRFDQQYLWGAEWWYWLHLQGESGMWERGKTLFETREINES